MEQKNYRILIQLPTDEFVGFLWVMKKRGGFMLTNRPERAKTFTSIRIMNYFIKCYCSHLPYCIVES